MGLPDELLAALKAQGISAPTPVQAAAVRPILSGRNVALQSATGTGKTLAYLLPLLSELQPWVPGKYPHRHGRVLVICPTQELCMQVLRAARDLLPRNRNKVQPLVGGANPLRQLMALKEHKPHIVVSTPGRLLKVIHKGGAFTDAFPLAASSRRGLREQQMILVLEEADKLLAMSDTVQVLRQLAALLTGDRQALLDYAAQVKAAKGWDRKQRFGRVPDVDEQDKAGFDDVDSQGVPQISSKVNFMRSVLQSYQVLLVSAGLKPSTLAGALAWAASNPVMISAPPPAAPVVLPGAPNSSSSSSRESSKQRRKSKYRDLSMGGCDEVESSQDPSSSSSSSSSTEEQQQRLLEMGLLRDAKGLRKGEIGARAERALMLPGHIQHQYLLYPHHKDGAMEKYLVRCLNLYLDKGCRALVFVGQRQNVWALQQQLQRSNTLKQELGCLHSALKPEEKASVLRRFNTGQLRALLLTDAYGLGMDFKNVDVVFGVESLPAGVQQYIRRAGRTGRMGRPGTVLNIIPDQRKEALRRTLKRLFITPQEMTLQQVPASSGGGWLLEPKFSAETLLAGERPHSRAQEQQQQQQQKPKLSPWGRMRKKCNGHGDTEGRGAGGVGAMA